MAVQFDGRSLVTDISPITNTLNKVFESRRTELREEQKLKAEEAKKKVIAELRRKSAQALTIREMDDPLKQRKALAIMAQEAYKNGGDVKLWNDLLNETDPVKRNLKLTNIGLKGAGLKNTEKFIDDRLKSKEFSQGTGIMSGWAFDKTTGTYSIDEELQNQLKADAEAKANKPGMLDSKDIAGINDKVTTLTKDVHAIVDSAKSLEALKNRGSPASQISAVFKFMKANDPTSTVRESELGMVFSAQGAMAGFAQYVTSLFGEGKLSDENFRDLVNTSKTLANSAIESSDGVVENYLSVLSDKMPESDIKKLRMRVPKRLEITEKATIKEGATATNPTTKERIIYRGGKWEAL